MAAAGERPVVGPQLGDAEVVLFRRHPAEAPAEVPEHRARVVDVEGQHRRQRGTVDQLIEDPGGRRARIVKALHRRAEAIEPREAARPGAEATHFKGRARRQGVGRTQCQGAGPHAGGEGARARTSGRVGAVEGDVRADVVDVDAAGPRESIVENQRAAAVDRQQRAAATVDEIHLRRRTEAAGRATSSQSQGAAADLHQTAEPGIVLSQSHRGPVRSRAPVIDHQLARPRHRAVHPHVARTGNVGPVDEPRRVRIETRLAIDCQGAAGASDDQRVGRSSGSDAPDAGPVVHGHVAGPDPCRPRAAEPSPERDAIPVQRHRGGIRNVHTLRLHVPGVHDDLRQIRHGAADVETRARRQCQGVAAAVEHLAGLAVADIDGLRPPDGGVAAQGQTEDRLAAVHHQIVIDQSAPSVGAGPGDHEILPCPDGRHHAVEVHLSAGRHLDDSIGRPRSRAEGTGRKQFEASARHAHRLPGGEHIGTSQRRHAAASDGRARTGQSDRPVDQRHAPGTCRDAEGRRAHGCQGRGRREHQIPR